MSNARESRMRKQAVRQKYAWNLRRFEDEVKRWSPIRQFYSFSASSKSTNWRLHPWTYYHMCTYDGNRTMKQNTVKVLRESLCSASFLWFFKFLMFVLMGSLLSSKKLRDTAIVWSDEGLMVVVNVSFDDGLTFETSALHQTTRTQNNHIHHCWLNPYSACSPAQQIQVQCFSKLVFQC